MADRKSSHIRFLPTLPSLLATPGRPFIHRDLSWLQFNERVLSEARRGSNSVRDRMKFLAISESNLDEFFMIRFASLSREALSPSQNPRERRHLGRVRHAILESVAAFSARQADTLDGLAEECRSLGVEIVRDAPTDDPSFRFGQALFQEKILPQLPPPEPLSWRRLRGAENLEMLAIFPGSGLVRVPRKLPLVFVEKAPDSETLFVFFLDDLILSHLGTALKLERKGGLLKITRDGDIDLDLLEGDHAGGQAGILQAVRAGLGRRDRGRTVRIQYAGDLSREFLGHCGPAFKLSPGQLVPAPHSLSLQGLWTAFHRLPELKPQVFPLPPAVAPAPPEGEGSIFDRLKAGDILLHHPYDSFDRYVDWIRAAARDPDVLGLDHTVYRTDAESPVLEALKEAAKSKKVRVLIELRARFDEANNLRVAEELERAGAQVAFGFGRLKIHAKLALVTRREGGELVRYTHFGTGNYNAHTARIYEDLSLLSSHTGLGEDAAHFFDSVLAGQIPSTFKHLVQAPSRLQKRLLGLIELETEAARQGKQTRIFAKVNALVDPLLIEKLYEASQAGVKVDLVVRGACSLIPRVRGLSENIRVVSIVDGILEHSRVYYFASSKSLFFSSADWMPRNFFSRLELAFPVLDPKIQDFVSQVLIPAYMGDLIRGRELVAQGTWQRRSLSGLGVRLRQESAKIYGSAPRRVQALFASLAASGAEKKGTG